MGIEFARPELETEMLRLDSAEKNSSATHQAHSFVVVVVVVASPSLNSAEEAGSSIADKPAGTAELREDCLSWLAAAGRDPD